MCLHFKMDGGPQSGLENMTLTTRRRVMGKPDCRRLKYHVRENPLCDGETERGAWSRWVRGGRRALREPFV